MRIFRARAIVGPQELVSFSGFVVAGTAGILVFATIHALSRIEDDAWLAASADQLLTEAKIRLPLVLENYMHFYPERLE